MPFVLLLIGAILFTAGVRGTNATLWNLVKGDFTGQHSFLPWLGAVAVVGGVGYIGSKNNELRSLSIAFMSLLLLVLLISNKGVVTQLASFVQNPVATQPATSTSTSTPNAS